MTPDMPSTTPPNELKKNKDGKSPSSSSVSMKVESDQRPGCSKGAKNNVAAASASEGEKGAIYDPIATTLFPEGKGGGLSKNVKSTNIVREPHSTTTSVEAKSRNAAEKTKKDKGSMECDEVPQGRSAPMAKKMSKGIRPKKKTNNKTRKIKIRINLVSGTGKNKEPVSGESKDNLSKSHTEKGGKRSRPLDDAFQQHDTAFASKAKNSFFCSDNDGHQVEESESHLHLLDFYSETHEDQDPTFREHAKLKQKERQDVELANLQKEEKEQRVRLESHLKKMWQNQIETMQESIKERRDAMMAKQETQRQQLLSTQKKRMESFQAKVQQSMTYQLQKQTGEKTSALQQHKQRTSDQIRAAKSQNERHSIQQEAMSVWTRISQQIQAKHQQEIQQFRLKEQEDQKKLEKRFKDQTQMLSQHHIMRQKEMMYDIQQEQKLFKSQRQHQQVYHVRLHRERTKERTQQVLDKVRSCKYYPSSSFQESPGSSLHSEDDAEIAAGREKRNSSRAETSNGVPKLLKSDSTVSDQNAPVKDTVRPTPGVSKSSGTEKDSFFQPEHSDAVLRQKLRKTVMSGTPIQLAVDLHNEGIVVHFRSGNQQASSGTPTSADSASNSKEKKVDLRGSPSSEPDGTGQSPADAGDGGSSSVGGSGGGAILASNSGRTWSSGSGGGTSEFIPWGVRAREVLYAIMCGEVPSGYASDKIDASGQGLLQGGQIKCMVTDMRTSDSVASAQRALAMMDLEKEKAKAEIAVLEKKAADFRAKLADKEKLSYRALREEKERNQDLNKANSDVEKTKRLFQELQMKSASYCGPGGALNPNIPEQQQLFQAMLRCKKDVEVAVEREAAARQAFDRARSLAAKTQISFSQSQKVSNAADAAVKKAIKKMQNDEAGASPASYSKKIRSDEEPDIEQSSKRIADVLSAIRATTDRRRKQLDSKRNCDTYLATSDQQMSAALKTSFRQKMEHRRLTIVLRPTRASIIKEVEHNVRAAEAKRAGSTVPQDDGVGNENELDPVLRAEQRLLLLLHPESPPEVLPSVPSVEKWAEPGWQVVLQAPSGRNAGGGHGPSSGRLLPRVERYPLLEVAQSTCCSAPGRQSAKIIKPWHLRMLSAPLSTVSRASAPAEPLPKDVAEILNAPVGLDPYNITHAEMEAGYNYVAPEPTETPKLVRKRSVNAPKETKEVVTPVAKRQRSSGAKAVEQDPNGSPNKGTSSAQKGEKNNIRERSDKSKAAQSDSATAKHMLRSPIPSDKNKGVAQKQKEMSKETKKHHQPQGQAMSKGGNTDQQYMAGMFPQQHSSPEQQQALFHRMMNQQKPMMQQPNMQNMQMHLSQQQGPPRQHAQQFQHQNRQNQQYQQQQQQYHQQRQLAQMRMQQQQMAYAAQSQPPQAPQPNAHYPQQMVPGQRPPAFGGQQGMPAAGSTGPMGSNAQQPQQRPPNAAARRTNPNSGEEMDPLDDPLLMLFDDGNF